jgi:hypothetical protein
VQEHDRLVARVDGHHPDRCVHRPVLGSRQQPVLPRHVGDSAVTTLGRPPKRPGELADAAGGVEDHVGIHLLAVHPYTDGPSSLAAHIINVTDAQRDAGLRLGGCPQDPFEDETPAAQPDHPPGQLGQGDLLSPSCDHVIQDLRHLGEKSLHDLLTEAVRMVELHHAPTIPRPVPVRPGVTIDDRDLMPATGEGDRGVEAGWARAHNSCPHVCSSITCQLRGQPLVSTSVAG